MTVQVIFIILGVSAYTFVLIWMLLRAARSSARAEKDPKYRRRLLLGGAGLYGFSVLLNSLRVAFGDAPPISLLGLPVALLMIWWFLSRARKTKVGGEQ